MQCPNCKSEIRKVEVKVEGAKSRAIIYQCLKCDYFEFDDKSATKVLEELKDQPLKIKQKVVKLSNNRLGLYFNKHAIGSLVLKP